MDINREGSFSMLEKKLICTACGSTFSLRENLARCQKCREPLEIEEFISKNIDTEERSDIFKRYKSFFPFQSSCSGLSLGEGMTPLLSAPSFAEKYGGERNIFKERNSKPHVVF